MEHLKGSTNETAEVILKKERQEEKEWMTKEERQYMNWSNGTEYEIMQKEEWLNEECAEINKKEKKTDVKSMYKRF